MHLLDGNVLVALASPDHPHYDPATEWFGSARPFATCPSTQGTLVRVLVRLGRPVGEAVAGLREITGLRGHEFWHDDATYLDVPMTGVIGTRQVTDAYLTHQARRHNAKLATLDSGLAALHPDVAELVPT